jgi:hypothetical protein
VRGDPSAANACGVWIDKLTELLPSEDAAGSPPGAGAEDAIASAIFTLKAIPEGDAQDVTWAAERGINAVTDLVRHRWVRAKGRLPSPSEGFDDVIAASLAAAMDIDLQELQATPAIDSASAVSRALETRSTAQQVPAE